MARKKLGEILIQAGVIDEAKLRAALHEQQRWGGPLGKILIEMKFCTEDVLVQALSQQLGLPAARLEGRKIPPQALELVPVDLCQQHALMPFGRDGKFLEVAMADPTNLAVIDDLRIRTRLNVRAYLAGTRDIERAIALHYRGEHLTDEPAGDEMAVTSLSEFSVPRGVPRAGQPLFAGQSASVPALQAAALASAPAPAPDQMSALRARVAELEALLARDEDVLRKLMGLLIRKGICTREEILEQLK